MTSQELAANPPSDQASTQPGALKYEALGTARTILVVVYLAVAVWYLVWRTTTFNPQAMTFSVVLYVAETLGFVAAVMHIFMVWRLTVREAPAAPMGLTVDVVITTYDEPVSLVRRTLLAVIRMDYPHQTWLLDDGSRESIRDLAHELGCRYIARPENVNAKAGNLNNALRYSRAEFFVVFDADHAPARDFLRRTLGYFRDPDVAFVQTPQDFYNLDSYQHRRDRRRGLIWTEQSLFFRVIQRGKDYWNAAFFCGSCAVLRRRALDEVKGFATGTVTEDLETSIRLHRKGFKSVYHAQSLAFGIAPSTVVPFLKQRVRWGQGAMQALRGSGILFGGGWTGAQRVCYLATVLTYFEGWLKAVFYLAPVIVLTPGVMPVAAVSWLFLAHFIPYYLLTFWAFEEVGRGFGRTVKIEQYNMARFAAFVWSTFGILSRDLRFRVTQKQGGDVDESRRWMLPQGLVFLLSVVAIPVGIFITWGQGLLPTGALIFNLIWAGINASLARAVLGFTVRLALFKRHEYRFPIPLPALLEFPGGHPANGVLDDISSEGFKFYGRFPEQVRPGTHITGDLYLPAARLPFKAEVRALIHADGVASHVKALGCRFEWKRETDRDELNAFLYGSGLQWRLNHLGEQARTPLEWMAESLGLRRRRAPLQAERWASALIRPVAKPSAAAQVSLVSVPRADSAQRTVITFRPVPVDEELRLVVSTRTSAQTLEGPCELVETITSTTPAIYAYSFHIHNSRPPGRWNGHA